MDPDFDPAPHQRVRKSATTGLKTLRGSILSLCASVVSVHGPIWLHFEPLKLQNFDLNPYTGSQNNVDLDMQPGPGLYLFFLRLLVLKHLIFKTSPADSQF